MAIQSINPATGQVLKTFEPDSPTEVGRKIALASETFREWRRVPFAERARRMARAAEILEAGRERFGRMMTQEMGKSIRSAREEAAKCARACRYYAEQAARLLAEQRVETSATLSYVRFQPLGPVLAVMPWNFPFWQVFRFAAPALMAGNVGLLKHASNVPQCALAIQEVFREAGFPEGAFQTLLIGSRQVAEVLSDGRIQAATLTGSEPAGSQVAGHAGRLIKKTVLELGGSDPFIVMPSADLEAAVKTAVEARTVNNGQSCIAAKRFLLAEPVAEEFTRRFVAGMEALRVGDPMEEATEVGPLATREILETLEEQVRRSVQAGARVLTGGRRLGGPGNYYAPTVLADVPESAPAFSEELFGPVAPLFRFGAIEEAIRLANATPFGLGASVWTNDAADRQRFIDEIEAGMVFLNGMVVSDPRLPFGGVKRSGYGRELSEFGLREFVNIQTVWIR
ncbi:MAG: NAD-dependent succinate-semialdehyde dehydrogenase [Bryobacteraceae bacterium]|jgi:succinate-semialdehyde dehydrogenase/glutarate-semialdehyde dehydrogenase